LAQYDLVSVPQLSGTVGWKYIGNAANQVFSGAVSGDGYVHDAFGVPVAAGIGAGTNLFGGDAIYDSRRALLCPLACADWSNGSRAGAWAANLGAARTAWNSNVGFRAACYL
jgi:hypothetical protein